MIVSYIPIILGHLPAVVRYILVIVGCMIGQLHPQRSRFSTPRNSFPLLVRNSMEEPHAAKKTGNVFPNSG